MHKTTTVPSHILGETQTHISSWYKRIPSCSRQLVDKIKKENISQIQSCKFRMTLPWVIQKSMNFDESWYFCVKMSFVLLWHQARCCAWTPNKTSGWMWLLSSLQGFKSKNTMWLFVTAISVSKWLIGLTRFLDNLFWPLKYSSDTWCNCYIPVACDLFASVGDIRGNNIHNISLADHV